MLKKNLYSIAFAQNGLCLLGSSGLNILLEVYASSLIMSTDESGILKPTTIVLLSIFLRFVNICVIYSGAPWLYLHIFSICPRDISISNIFAFLILVCIMQRAWLLS